MPDTKLTLLGREVDLAGKVPLRVGDLRKLSAQHGVSIQTLASGKADIETLWSIGVYILGQVEPPFTPDEVDQLSFEELATVVGLAMSGPVDRPT